MRETLTFDDVLLVPQYSQIESRTSIRLDQDVTKAFRSDLPIVSSPMDTVTEASMLVAMSASGGLGIVHRYNSIEDQVRIVSEAASHAGASQETL